MNFDEYQQLASKTAIYDRKYAVMYPALGAAGEIGEVCNKVKKIYRDNDGVVTDEVKEKLFWEISDVSWYLAALCTDLGFSWSEIAQANIDKLYDRKERGVLKGDGDNR
jgi:NTP pyrophosphatase (non-canonical NTP hydrolase)